MLCRTTEFNVPPELGGGVCKERRPQKVLASDQTEKMRYELALVPILDRLCAPGLAVCFILTTIGNNSCMPLNLGR